MLLPLEPVVVAEEPPLEPVPETLTVDEPSTTEADPPTQELSAEEFRQHTFPSWFNVDETLTATLNGDWSRVSCSTGLVTNVETNGSA